MRDRHLACAADARYVPHSAVMLHSAATSGGGQFVVHYLHGPDFPAAAARHLEHMLSPYQATISWHEITEHRLTDLPLDHRFGPAMWYRIFLPELLPAVQRVLYLDIDAIVTDRLDPLWEQPLEDCYLGAVTNVFMEYHRAHADELAISPADYFNSGVLLLNLSLMRDTAFAEAVLDLVRSRGSKLLWPDQDALNLTVGGRRLPLHPRWNVMNSFKSRPELARQVFGAEVLMEALTRPGIRHFEGPDRNKPWHLLHDADGQELYRRHRTATPWPDFAPEGNNARNRARLRVARARSRARDLASRMIVRP